MQNANAMQKDKAVGQNKIFEGSNMSASHSAFTLSLSCAALTLTGLGPISPLQFALGSLLSGWPRRQLSNSTHPALVNNTTFIAAHVADLKWEVCVVQL